VDHVQQRSISSIPENILIEVPLDGPTCGDSAQIGTRKSLAPYRDCLGRDRCAKMRRAGRGSFDRDDLKEAAGVAVRAMEPLAWFGDVEAAYRCCCARWKLWKSSFPMFEQAW